jgi:hypothetical protein
MGHSTTREENAFVLKVRRASASIIACYASPATLDALPSPRDTHVCRVAPEELWLVAPVFEGDAVLSSAAAHLTAQEPTAIAIDQSDGWVVRSLFGDDALTVLAQLSVFRFPDMRPEFVQGSVAGAPAKVLLLFGAAHVFVPHPLRHYVDARLQDVGGAAARAGLEMSAVALDSPLTSNVSRQAAV